MGSWSNLSGTGTGCTGLGGGVVGSWARDPLARVLADKTPHKEAALLRDQVSIGGLRAELWHGVGGADEGYQRCACYKESQQQADRKCSTCHGIGYAPGYLKWGYETYWLSVRDPGVVFTNTEVSTTFRSAKSQLVEGATTGTLESPDYSFSRTAYGSVWDSEAVDFVRVEGESSVTVEYSLDAGVTWKGVDFLKSENPSNGFIRFKATLQRVSADVRSPLFEIVRARYSRIDVGTKYDSFTKSVRSGPWILVMATHPEQQYVKSERGDLPQQQNTSFWTVGMSMFDPKVVPNTLEERIVGPNIVVGFLDGALSGKRYVTSAWSFSDPLGYVLTSQTFKVRITDDVGPYNLVW